MNKTLKQYAIYDHPKDHPHFFVVREWIIGPGTCTPGPMIALCDTLEQARRKVPEGYSCLPRFTEDDPVIVEVWI